MNTLHTAAALAMAAACLTAPAPALAQAPPPAVPIALPATANSATFKGVVKGYASIDYRFEGQAGRRLRVDLHSRNPSLYFNVLREGQDEAIFIGSVGGARYEAALPADGAYRIRVYLMRNAARRGAQALFTLDLRSPP